MVVCCVWRYIQTSLARFWFFCWYLQHVSCFWLFDLNMAKVLAQSNVMLFYFPYNEYNRRDLYIKASHQRLKVWCWAKLTHSWYNAVILNSARADGERLPDHVQCLASTGDSFIDRATLTLMYLLIVDYHCNFHCDMITPNFCSYLLAHALLISSNNSWNSSVSANDSERFVFRFFRCVGEND